MKPTTVQAPITVVLSVIQGIILNSLGDAARYLDPHPDNVASRHAIRTAGLETIRRMHESGEYRRIVPIGHSLGSVIAYDIINHLWQSYGSVFNKPEAWPDHLRSADLRKQAQPALQAVQELGTALEQSPNPPNDPTISTFQAAQRSCWLEFREMGNPLLITDFISLGSPLAHASMLMARNRDELDERKGDRELPTCPPSTSGKETYSYKDTPYNLNGQTRFVRVPHHAAPFVCTRWTNIYYPLQYGFLGDIVGGPLNGLLGQGIRDIPLTDTSVGRLPLVPHIRYWKSGFGGDSKTALAALKDAVGVNSKSWLDRPSTGD